MEINATNARTQFAEINGKKIAYRSIGQGYPMILCQRFRDKDTLVALDQLQHYGKGGIDYV